MALNDSFDVIKNLLNEAAQAAVRATKSAAALTKANVNLQTEQSKQRKAYLELGKLYYRDFITGEEPDEAEYLPLCEAITEATKNIESLKGTVEELKANVFTREEPEAEEAAEAETEPVKETPDLETQLEDLHKELDELEEELHKLDGVEEAPAAPVFEVVEDEKPQE